MFSFADWGEEEKGKRKREEDGEAAPSSAGRCHAQVP